MGDLSAADSDAPPIDLTEPFGTSSTLHPSLRGLPLVPVLEVDDQPDPIAAALKQPYTPYYCEENVYLLLKTLQNKSVVHRAYAVFISNPTRSVWLFQQLASTREDEDYSVNWDYHVIPVVNDGTWWVLDRDSRLGPKVPLKDYFDKTFQPTIFSDLPLTFEGRSRFRVVSADHFLARFASDRSHMITMPATSPPSFVQPPPPYPPLCGPAALARGETHNLWTHYLSMDVPDPLIASGDIPEDFGQLIEMEDFVAFFRNSSSEADEKG